MAITNNPDFQSALEVFYVTMLQEIYWSEIHQVEVLQTMSTAASADALKESFSRHQQQSQTHVERLEKVFGMMTIPAEAEPSIGLQGLFDEGWQVIDETQEGSAQRDVALIIAAQKVEHYEIACYGSLVTLSRTLGRNDIADILVLSLNEEKDTDSLLTGIAEGNINYEASQEPSPELSGQQAEQKDSASMEQQRKEALTERD